MSRTFCVVSGNRADYGLLRWLMRDIADDPQLKLQVIATGMHLWPGAGLTYRDIEADRFHIDRAIPLPLDDDSPAGVGVSIGTATIGFAHAFRELRPDLLIVLGDRFEILAAVSAALVARIPVAHLHGGERSEGAFDDAIRHAITKMSHLHFVAAPEFHARVVQMGEDPAAVAVVGALGLDGLTREPLMTRAELESALGVDLGARNLLVTFHSATLGADSAAQFDELLAALDASPDISPIITMPNTEGGGIELWRRAELFAATRSHVRLVASLGHRRYLSALQFVDGVIGNSSSGLIEAPSFKIGTINIGRRQEGRLKAASVIDCEPTRAAITAAIRRLYSDAFTATLPEVVNPYGTPGAARRILERLRQVALEGLIEKSFVDHRIVGVTS